MARSGFKKFVKKTARAVRGKAIKRYFNKGYKPKIGQIATDVSRLKTLLNVEKKRITQNSSAIQSAGQVSGNSNGFYSLDMTPLIAQGLGYNQRTGSSVKWTSSFLQLQLTHQASAVARIRYEVHIVKVVGTPFSSMTTAMSQYMTPSYFINQQNGGTNIYDLTCSRNQDYFKTFRVIRRVKGSLEPDQLSGQPVIKTFNIPLKFKSHHIKYDGNTTTPTNGQVLLFILCDSGNIGGVASTLVGIPQTASATGLWYQYNFTHYYVDN